MIDFSYRVRLDRLRQSDSNIIREWRNEPDIWRWCRQNDLISIQDHNHWFESSGREMYGVKNTDNILIGVCGLTNVDLHNRRGEFSLYIAPEHQKKGYSVPALKTLFHHGFHNLGFKLIWGETFFDNPAQHIFEKLGMKKEGLRRSFYFKDGRFCDAILYSMIDTEFLELKDKW